MTRQEVTFDDVAAAAGSLQGDGKPVTIEAVSSALGGASVTAIHAHLSQWRASHAKPADAPKFDLPDSIATALGDWVRQMADQAGAGIRDSLAQSESDLDALLKSGQQLEGQSAQLQTRLDEALATLEEQREHIERLTAELRNARLVATDALVGKAKDQLAIEGKDSQLVDLRAQIERNVAASAALSDARLAAEMELVGAVTARDNFAAEIKDLRAQLDARLAKGL